MPTIHRLATSVLFLSCLALLAVAADDEKTTTITATPSFFASEDCNSDSAISPDGKYVAYQPTPRDVHTRPPWHLCDTLTKKVIHTLPALGARCAAFTPDSSRFVAISRRLNVKEPNGPLYQVEVYDVKTGKQLRAIALKGEQWGGSGNGCNTLADSITNDILVLKGRSDLVTVYDLKTGKVLGDLPGSRQVHFMALSRDGRWLVTTEVKPPFEAGRPGTGTPYTEVVHTWDVKARKYGRRLYEAAGLIEAIAMSHDGNWCAVGTSWGARVFDRTTGGEKAVWPTGKPWPNAFAFSPDGKRIIFTSNGLLTPKHREWGIRFWDWQKNAPPRMVVSPLTDEEKQQWDRNGRPRLEMLKRIKPNKVWLAKGGFYANLMSDDGTRFFSAGGTGGRLLLDLKNPNPPPEKKPEEPKAKK